MRITGDEVAASGADGVTTLPAAFNLRLSLVRTGVLAGGLALIGALTWRAGGLVLVAVGLSVLVAFGLRAWGKSRVAVVLDAERIHVRSLSGERAMDADRIRAVKYVFNGRSPDVRLVPDHGRSLIVPASQVTGGHAVLFRWLAGAAPHADYDPRTDVIRRAVRELDQRHRP